MDATVAPFCLKVRSSSFYSCWLTFEEVGKVVECAVLWVSIPLLEGHAVEGLQLEGLAFTVHHDNLTGVSVQTRHVLHENKHRTHRERLSSRRHQLRPRLYQDQGQTSTLSRLVSIRDQDQAKIFEVQDQYQTKTLRLESIKIKTRSRHLRF